jgi:hypothetical protein
MTGRSISVNRITDRGADESGQPIPRESLYPRLDLFGDRCFYSVTPRQEAFASLYFVNNATFLGAYALVGFSESDGSEDLCDIVRFRSVDAAAPITTTACFWRLEIENRNECAHGDAISPNSSLWGAAPSHRAYAYVHAFMPEDNDIAVAHKEITDLLQAMTRGENVARSDEFLELCGKLADQISTTEELVDVDDWADKLAADLSEFMD